LTSMLIEEEALVMLLHLIHYSEKLKLG